jgi:hypothetical protein
MEHFFSLRISLIFFILLHYFPDPFWVLWPEKFGKLQIRSPAASVMRVDE